MPPASIRSLKNGVSPLVGVSRDDLVGGDLVTVESVNGHTTYAWTLAYRPPGSTAAFSGSASNPSPGSFVVDQEGPYLVRLTANLGLGTESAQYVRLRALTVLGELQLVAAGEGYGLVTYASGAIMVNTAPLAAGDLVVIGGVPLVGVGGARTPGGNNFNASTGTLAAMAAELSAAINDPANSFTGLVTATALSNVATLTAVDPGITGNTTTLGVATVPAGRLTASGATLAGGRSLPVPVDQTPTGWTDALNTNLTTLLGLVGRVSSSANVFYVDLTPGFGDYTTIQAAIDAAVAAGVSAVNPYVVLVQPGTYVENLTFAPHVYISGWPGSWATQVGFPLVLIRGAHAVPTPGGADSVVVTNVTLLNNVASANATVLKTGAGSVTFQQCSIEQMGAGGGQGPALQVGGGFALLVDCSLTTVHADDTHSAITQPSTSTVSLVRTSVLGPTGLTLNTSGDPLVITSLQGSEVTGQGATSFAILSDATSLSIKGSVVTSANVVTLTVHPGGGAFADDQAIIIENSVISGQIAFDISGILGATTIDVGSSSYESLSFPGGDPTTTATTDSTTLFYDNTVSGLTAANVQEAIDEVMSIWNNVRTLDDAYDGGVPASGSGRTIVADAGSVQVVNAEIPSDPPVAGDTDGMLEVVGAVKVGALSFPEVDVDPNPYGSGPSILLGNRVVPGNIPYGTGTAILMGRSTGTPLFRNYNLRVQTESSIGGGAVGRLVLQGGYGLPNGVTTPDASSVYVLAGHALDATAVPGNLVLSPGGRTGGVPGFLRLVRPQGSTAATLTAAGVCANPLGVAGDITFATDMGAVTASLLATDTRAQVVAKINALDGVSAAEAGGIITVTSGHLGETAEVYFLSASAGVDVAIGGFDGVAQVNGTYAQFIDVQVSADQEVSFGVGGGAGPLVYNATTGKLTVPGIIDPTAVVFEEAGAPSTDATEGAVFVSDGTGGLVLGHFYYRGASDAVPVDLSAAGAVPTLAAVLVAGNTTDGTNLVISAADSLDASAGILLLPLAVAPAQTANGSMVWDSNDFILTVGDGGVRKTMVDTTTSQTLTNKTITLPTILLDDANNAAVSDVVTLAHTTSGVAAPNIGTGLLFRAEDSAGALTDVGRVAGILENVTPGAETGGVSFHTRTGGGAITLRWAFGGSGSLKPAVDNAHQIGDNIYRVSSVTSNIFSAYNASADVNPTYRMDNAGFSGGPGGAGVLDTSLTRILSGSALWSMNVGLRVGGNVVRHEGGITFGTTRTAAGGGDAVTVQPGAAVAAAASSQPGGSLNLFGSAAAATGGGNFAASGGAVAITAGNSAAVNAAQANGAIVTITGGTAASGAGGGAASGGSVGLVGADGVAGGDGGAITIKPGALNGGGADGRVVFRVSGAARTPDVVPRATNEGNLGITTTRWATVNFRDEDSTGQKKVGLASKAFGDSPYTILAADYVVLYDPAGGNSTVNLPSAATSTNRVLIIKHSSASGNSVTIDGNAGDLIDGNPTLVLTSYQSAMIISNGTNWFIL